jgi:membrane-bound lytic murein transglycosylase B
MTARFNRLAKGAILTGLLATASVQADFSACLSDLHSDATDEGVSREVADQLLTGVEPSDRVIELDRNQPEFTSTLKGYLDQRVTQTRIEQGRALLAEHEAQLERIRERYGVPGRYIVAFWGLETHYGQYVGDMPTIRSLATLACDRRRGAFFRDELIAAMQLVDNGTVEADRLRGSWAGALGNFQFLPSVYRDHAVDADGDGRADLWESFADAAESAGAFLAARGWQAGERWGREVRLPQDFDYSLAETEASLRDWAERGIQGTNGSALPNADLNATLVVPAGAQGPAFLVYENFDVIMRWNPSRFYALSVGHLADRLIGAPGLDRAPPDEPPLAIKTIEAMQTALNQRGYDAGSPDGRMGPATRSALRAFQRDAGLVADGHPNPDTLAEIDETLTQD